jgi:hypothetical protein
MKDEDEFLPKSAYYRSRGVLTKTCAECRERSNRKKRIWYATKEQVRIGKAPIL